LLNFSITAGQIPDIWRTAIVTPIPKVSQPGGCSDYRPISVTPILSRITERIIVNRWLRPSIPPELLANQYAYKPTGSTTVALVHLFHSLTRMLENSAYVRAILIDFTKAFDVADHTVLMSKLADLQLPGNIYNWIGSFLFGRQQVCRFNGAVSELQSFNLGFVQGSGLGPTLFLVLASDLNTLSSNNELIKFADDSTLLVPGNSDVNATMEFNHIQDWAKHNSMIINLGKTKEIIFYNPRAIPSLTPLPIFGIEQVSSAKLLGVYIQCNFSCDILP